MIENSVLILGVGNVIMGDEGVGVHFIRSLSDVELPENVDILDGGTAGFQLMSFIQGYPTVFLVDATLDGKPPGNIEMLEPRFSEEFPTALSAHDIGLKDVIEGSQLSGYLPKIYLFTVSIERVQPMRLELSEPVNEALPELKKRVLQLIHDLKSIQNA